MQPLSDKSKWKMLQAFAHDLCNAAHPEDQVNMTGWMSLDGEFLVSCAWCKEQAYRIYTEAVRDAYVRSNGD